MRNHRDKTMKVHQVYLPPKLVTEHCTKKTYLHFQQLHSGNEVYIWKLDERTINEFIVYIVFL